ncbi:hypothetical protein ACFJGV_12850 [Cnuibacter sp. UC19_7]|uniref:hypothetical protein n=1 Tax=Cnuibacter sp. UC19_7 TaxID=3350166 RepID=UPI00366F4F4E
MDPAEIAQAEATLDRLTFPVCSITGPVEAVEQAGALLDERLQETGYRRKEPENPSPSAYLYERGGLGRSVLAVAADAAVSGGGSTWNLKLHLLVERTSPGELLFSVHGVDPSLRARFDPDKTFGEMLNDVTEAVPAVERSAWFGASSLPPHLASSPTGFKALIGPAAAFWWT